MKGRALLIPAAFLVFAGCAGPFRVHDLGAPLGPHPPSGAPEAVRRCDATTVLESVDRARRASPKRLAKELKAAKMARDESEQACERVRLGALMLLAEPETKDEGKILKLLDGVADGADPGGKGIEPLARLLAAAIRRQQAYEDQVRELNRKVDEERARADSLKRQLDALKNIEKIMNERQKK